MLGLQVQQPVLCNVPGSSQAVPGLYLGHTQTVEEGQKQYRVLLNGLTLESVNEHDIVPAAHEPKPLLTLLASHTSLEGTEAVWKLAGTRRDLSVERKQKEEHVLGAPQQWVAVTKARRTSSSKPVQVVIGPADCAPLAHVMFRLWMERKGLEPSSDILRAGKMLGVDILPQVVAHLGLTMPDVEAKVSYKEGHSFQSVNNCRKVGRQPAGTAVNTGKHATPEPAGGIELQGPPLKQARTRGNSKHLPPDPVLPPHAYPHSSSRQHAASRADGAGSMLLPAQPLVLNGRNATPSSMQQWQHAAAQSPAPAAAAAAASHPRRVLSVVSGSRSLSQQLGAHPQQLASFLPVQQMNSKGPMEQVLGRSSGSIAAARSAAADAAGSALGLGASAASSGSMPAAAAAATTTNATAASEQGAAADLCSEYVDCLKKDSVTLPVMERNSSGAAAELVEYKILEKLGSGGFGTVYKVLRVAADSSSAASSNGSSTGASSSQEFAMKVFTVRTSRSQATTWTQCRQALSKQQQQSTVAAKQQQQQQPGLASQQQQGRVQAADGGPAASRLHTNGTEAEQQQQNQSQPAQASLQQQTFAAQHTAAEQHRATSTSSGDSGMSKDAPRWTSQQLDQQRLAVSDSSTFSQCDEIREMQEKLGHMQAARNLELQLMLLAKGDLRGASIARGNDSSMWLPATPEHELCSGVLRVQGWGQFSMQIEQLQVPVLVSELCSCMVADLLQLIRAVNNACGVQQVGLTREETRHLARQLVRALASMHKVDIVHRDIKPENMLLVGPKLDDWKGKRPDVFSYFVKIADFGVARELAAGDASSTIAGTPGYMAPEVHKAHCARGAAGGAAAGTHRLQYDKSVDVYSSGIVVALMRTNDVRSWMKRDDPNAAQRCLAADLDSPTCRLDISSARYVGGQLTALEKSFLKACIDKDLKQRWTAEKLLHHDYITQ